MSPDGAYHYAGGWNRTAVISLCVSACLSIGFALLGAGSAVNVGDWGWLIGAGAGAALSTAMSGFSLRAAALGTANKSGTRHHGETP